MLSFPIGRYGAAAGAGFMVNGGGSIGALAETGKSNLAATLASTPRREFAMLRCSRKDSRHPQTCSCLLEAYRNFPAEPEAGKGCTSPNCPVRTLDGITLHQFLEAIGGPEGADDAGAKAQAGNEISLFRAVARRRKRRMFKRESD